MLTEKTWSGCRLCVVGNINRDIKTSPVSPDATLFSDGETSVDWVVETIGGGGANSAFAGAALGAQVSFVAKVGRDGLGERLERTLRKHGVAAYLAVDAEKRTGSSLALSFRNGHRHFLSCLPASRALRFEDIDLQSLDGVDHLLRADIWFSEPMLYGGNAQLFAEARARGIDVSIDLNWDPAWGSAEASAIQVRKEAIRAVLPNVSIAHGNVRELSVFADAPDLTTALERITGWGAQAVVVHLGKEGAGWYQDGRLEIEPPVLARHQVTSTGSGDVLSLCMMLSHKAKGVSVCERMKLANRVVSEFMEGKRRLLPDLED